MTTVVDRKTAAAKYLIVGVGVLMTVGGAFHFLVTTSGKPDAALSWSWAFVAMGLGVILGGLLIGRKSRLVRVLLVVGIVALFVSIFLVKFAQVTTT